MIYWEHITAQIPLKTFVTNQLDDVNLSLKLASLNCFYFSVSSRHQQTRTFMWKLRFWQDEQDGAWSR